MPTYGHHPSQRYEPSVRNKSTLYGRDSFKGCLPLCPIMTARCNGVFPAEERKQSFYSNFNRNRKESSDKIFLKADTVWVI